MNTQVAASLWVFRTLFAAVHKSPQNPHFPSFRLPETLLFTGGRPSHWLSFSTETSRLSAVEVPRNDASVLLQIMLKMREFSGEFTGLGSGSLEEAQCVVWYDDMKVETLSTKQLFEVFSSVDWQRQILCIQAYMDMASSTTAEYNAQMNSDSQGHLSVHEPRGHPTKAFVHRIALLLEDECKEKVDVIRCRFCEDPSGNWWLVHTILAKMQPVQLSQPMPIVASDITMICAPKTSSAVSLTETPKAFSTVVLPRITPARLDLLIVLDAGMPLAEAKKEVAKICVGLCHTRVIVAEIQASNGQIPVSPVTLNSLVEWVYLVMKAHRVGMSNSVFLCGFGIGASVCLRIATANPPRRLACLALVNGFAYIDATLRKRLPQISEISTTKFPVEEFLSDEFDLLDDVKKLNVPLLMLQATDNQLVLPLHVEAIARRFRNSAVKHSIQVCIEGPPPCCHIGWLRATHNVLAERIDYLASFYAEIETALAKSLPPLEEAEADADIDDIVQSTVVQLEPMQEEESSSLRDNKRVSVFDAGRLYTEPPPDEAMIKGVHQEASAGELEATSAVDSSSASSNSSQENSSDDPSLTIATTNPIPATLRREVSLELGQRRFLAPIEEREQMSVEDTASRDFRRESRKAAEWEAQSSVSSSRLALLAQLRQKEGLRGHQIVLAKRRLEPAAVALDEDELHEGVTPAGGVAKLRLGFLTIARRQAVAIARVTELSHMVREAASELALAEKEKSQLERGKYMLQTKLRRCEKRRRRGELERELEKICEGLEVTVLSVADKAKRLRDLRNELAKMDGRVQTDCIILERRATELKQVKAQLEDKLKEAHGNSDRLDTELSGIEAQQKAMARLMGKLDDRENSLAQECARISKLKTTFIDSALWQAGVLQRMKADDLRQYLLNELAAVRSRKAGLRKRMDDADEQNTIVQASIAKCLTNIANTSSQLRLLQELLQAYDSGKLRSGETTSSAAPSSSTQETSTPKQNVTFTEDDLGAAVRKKPEAKLSIDEKDWLFLDSVARGKQPASPDLPKDRVMFLLSLPEEVNLALPFFLNPGELRAYQLLQKFSLGRTDQAQLERDEKAGRERCPEKLVICEELTKDSAFQKGKMLVRQEWAMIYASTWQRLGARQGRVHCFQVREADILLALKVTVVFEGEFRRDAYVCGRLSAALYWNEVPIGCAASPAVNTSDQMGRVVLLHSPGNHAVPLRDGEYRVVIATSSATRYSVEVRMEKAQRVKDAVEQSISDLREMRSRKAEIEAEKDNVDESVYLSERKRHLVKQMQEEAERKCAELEIEISELARLAREDPDIQPKDQLEKQLCLAKSIRLTASRRKELEDVTAGAEELRKIKRDMVHELNKIAAREVFYAKLGLHVEEQEVVKQQKPVKAEQENLPEQEFADVCWADVEFSIKSMRHPREQECLTRPELLVLLRHGASDLKGKLLVQLMRERIPEIAKAVLEGKPERSETKYDIDGAVELDVDVDERCRQVLRELERANSSKEKTMDSALLHGSTQRFAVVTLRKELNRELDRLLTLQVLERERAVQRSELPLEANSQYGSETSSSEPTTSSEEEESVDEEEVFDLNFCRACGTSPCSWKSRVDLVEVKKRIILLENELNGARLNEAEFLECTILFTGKTRYVRKDLLERLSDELHKEQRRERLALVDAELHDAHATTKAFIETQALHGFRQVQWTENVKIALEGERKRLEAEDVAHETVEGMLDWMLAGWYFGEVATHEPPQKVDTLEARVLENFHGNDRSARGDPREKWLQIAEQSRRAQARRYAVDEVHEVKTKLEDTENVLRFGLFLLTMMYFRAMNLLKKSRFPDASKINHSNLSGITPTAHQAARVAQRSKAMKSAMSKATEGERCKQERALMKQRLERTRLREQLEKIKLESASARAIQRILRGYLGRKAAQKWTLMAVERRAQANLRFAAAALLQRVFRGYQGRLIAEDKRTELAEFIAKVRAREAREEEEEFWRRHPIKRVLRNLQFMKRQRKSNNAPDILNEESDVDSIASLNEEVGV